MTDDIGRGFKRKTIARTIKHKIKGWLASIDDEALRDKVEKDYIVTGGCIASMLMGQLPNDYDVYLKTPEVALDLANYYITLMLKPKDDEVMVVDDKVSVIASVLDPNRRVRIVIKSVGALSSDGTEGYQYFEQLPVAEMEDYIHRLRKKSGKDFTPALVTSNAISLHGGVQVIFRFTGPPEEIHHNFDFVHCTNWYADGELHLNQAALEAILSKELQYIGSLYPICSVFRIKKFLQRGWTITAGTMLKISWDISELDLSQREVLQEQLVGMDAAYFHQVIALLREGDTIDRTYLYELINRVFDTDEFNSEWMDVQ